VKLILKLAWRNISRNMRRSVITIAAVTFAVLLSVVMRGMQLGTYENNINSAVKMFTGHLQIQHKDFKSNPALTKSFKYDDAIKDILDNRADEMIYTPRIYGNGLIGFNDNSSGVILFGMDPDTETKTSTIHERVKEGEFISNDAPYDIVIGNKLAGNLNASIGDTVVILASCMDGSTGNMKFRIRGLSRSGSQEMDAMGVFMTLEAADELLSMYGKITALAISTDGLAEMDRLKPILKTEINNVQLVVLDWKDLMPELKQMIDMDDAGGIIMLIILMIIMSFGILNTILMSVTERFKEFGIMLAIGTKKGKLVSIVIFETIFIVLLGLLVGNILAWISNYILYLNPITFTGEIAKMYEDYGFLPILSTTMNPVIFIYTSLSVIAMSALAVIYPAFRVLKLEALKGIRYT
jgi:putative ABC transport system permease protein